MVRRSTGRAWAGTPVRLLVLLVCWSLTQACAPGTGGPDCNFSLQSLYWDQAQYVWQGQQDPLDLQGWNVQEQLYRHVLNSVNATFVVEVGVWKGASTAAYAKWLKHHQRGVVAAVDPFTGSVEHWLKDATGQPVYTGVTQLPLQQGRPALYQLFLSNMRHLELQDYIVPFPVTSQVAAAYFKAKNLLADFIHLDGGHDYEDVRNDLLVWWDLVRPGGVIMGDDYSTGWPGVMKAADEFGQQRGIKLMSRHFKFWFWKPDGGPSPNQEYAT